jgi:hypothetical protein
MRSAQASGGSFHDGLRKPPAATLVNAHMLISINTRRGAALPEPWLAGYGWLSAATRTTVRPRAMPFKYASKCVGRSSKSIVRTSSWTRSGRQSTASLFHSVCRSDIGQFALSVPRGG